MIALDTNVLVRVVTNDDPRQAALAVEMMKANRLWLSKTVILEVAWVLSYAYDLERAAVIETIKKLGGLANVVVEDLAAVLQGLVWAEAGMDFADALHLAASRECSEFVTFDKSLVTKAKKVTGPTEVRLLGTVKK
ncbi:MAG: type II toxin-antitoxin system VapC family toxin [Deltaproteobacteria bacterium]|nr:type II toxin-antitoxin system VapC family toxin [Deltaproteobacteria bacterium]